MAEYSLLGFDFDLSDRKLTIIYLLGVVVLIGALILILNQVIMPREVYTESENVTLTTRDGWEIGGTWYEGGEKGVILLHMWNSHRFDQDTNDEVQKIPRLAERLQENGYSVMTIDMRGHGESTTKVDEDGTITHNDLIDDSSNDPEENDFIKMKYDVEAAADYLQEKSNITKLGIVGAELGANIALRYTDIGSPDTLVLISPRNSLATMYWKGVRITGANRNYENPVLYMASKYRSGGLPSRSYNSIDIESDHGLFGESPSEEKDAIILEEDAGRGTRMLNETLEEDIVEWFDEYL